ncbi:uncharacterized protein LOC129588375 isoform X2 [Paramacrobiotus metropolitanus]|uniref:uncharacterized protein LOC129588375 isoform X2 n=1 Tax=Paramacrobiotus metropolitanus TaxID=2943436 RepID=UPI0024463C09|nr:uncharacterized protein LOC129588375 isoform X2 [Paramacrobiotus metropolitanus]
MSYLYSWIVFFGCSGLVTVQGFYGSDNSSFGGYGDTGNPHGGGPQGGGHYVDPQSPMQHGGLGMLQGRRLPNSTNSQMSPQLPIYSGSGGIPMIFMNPDKAVADAFSAILSSIFNSRGMPMPFSVGAANTVLAPGLPGAPLPVQASAGNPYALYNGSDVAAYGVYGNRSTDNAFGRYGGNGSRMDDQWGIGTGFGSNRSGLNTGGFHGYGMGGGPYGRNFSSFNGSSPPAIIAVPVGPMMSGNFGSGPQINSFGGTVYQFPGATSVNIGLPAPSPSLIVPPGILRVQFSFSGTIAFIPFSHNASAAHNASAEYRYSKLIPRNESGHVP